MRVVHVLCRMCFARRLERIRDLRDSSLSLQQSEEALLFILRLGGIPAYLFRQLQRAFNVCPISDDQKD